MLFLETRNSGHYTSPGHTRVTCPIDRLQKNKYRDSMQALANNHKSRASAAAVPGYLKRVIAACALLVSLPAWSVMPDEEAQALVSAMLQESASYQNIVQTLIQDGRSLPEATQVTMRVVKPFEQRAQLARTALCMSRDIDEAERVTNAAIAAITPGDAVVDEIVSEFVKYQRSSCLDTEIIQRPPFEYATDSLIPGPGDVSPSR
jgi:hypothetical protein